MVDEMRVKVVKAEYDLRVLKRAICEAIEDLGINLQKRRKKRKALLKPNIVIPAKPSSAIITHPSVVQAVAEVLLDAGFEEIVVGEGAGLGADEAKIFKISRYRKLERENIRLLNLNRAERAEIRWKYGTLSVPKVLLDADFYVNLPKMKTHGNTTVTLSIKNQKGLLKNADKKRFHKLGLHEPLAALARAIQPDLIVVDAVECMEGEGPLNGKKKKVGALVVGTNLVAVDIACCEIMGIEWRKVEHIKLALRAFGLNEANYEPEILGSVEEVRTKFKPAGEFGRILHVYSWRNPYACSMCIDAFSLAVKSAVRKPKYWFSFFPKFLYEATFKRIDIIQGLNAKIPKNHGKIICLGDCTKKIAEKYGFTHVKGCPPRAEDILKALKNEKNGKNKRDRG